MGFLVNYPLETLVCWASTAVFLIVGMMLTFPFLEKGEKKDGRRSK